MIKNEKVISDMELDMVVGGARTLLLKKRDDGKVDGFLVATDDDLAQLKKLLDGGSVDNIRASARMRITQGIHAERLDTFIENKKKRYPGLEISWAE